MQMSQFDAVCNSLGCQASTDMSSMQGSCKAAAQTKEASHAKFLAAMRSYATGDLIALCIALCEAQYKDATSKGSENSHSAWKHPHQRKGSFTCTGHGHTQWLPFYTSFRALSKSVAPAMTPQDQTL